MPKYVIPFTGDLQVEAESVEAALEKACAWRKATVTSLLAKLEETGVQRVRYGAMAEVLEVDDAWLENERLRRKHRQEWKYVTHRVAIAPIGETEIESEGR